jgi:hypothetical protein
MESRDKILNDRGAASLRRLEGLSEGMKPL